MRVLFLLPGRVPPPQDPSRDRLYFLSDISSGAALLPVWWATAASAPAFLRAEFPLHRVGRFRYHLHLAYRWPKPLRSLARFLFYVNRGWRLHREEPFDVIVTYGTNATGLAAVLLQRLTGAKLVVEVPGVPENAFRYDRPRQGRASALKRAVASRLLNFVGGRADCMKLLYPSQLRHYPRLRNIPTAVFHDFVPVSQIREIATAERFVLSVGHPWYTKGMDVLIQAFLAVAPEFPEYRLKLMGYFPDRARLEELAAGCNRIEFLEARPNEAALEVIGACAVFVLASRTEAMGRVLLEAMAARKPILASAVGGIPFYLGDNKQGLLFAPGDATNLAARLTAVLGSEDLRQRFGEEGLRRVRSEYDERAYVASFQAMLRGTVSRTGRQWRQRKCRQIDE
ncbi:MAG TPA: glycosyltransferase family 4 protein [Terriglobales bacterium]|nr:glycosyltransferase family 4 protein [Terriglobales bacterium]